MTLRKWEKMIKLARMTKEILEYLVQEYDKDQSNDNHYFNRDSRDFQRELRQKFSFETSHVAIFKLFNNEKRMQKIRKEMSSAGVNFPEKVNKEMLTKDKKLTTAAVNISEKVNKKVNEDPVIVNFSDQNKLTEIPKVNTEKKKIQDWTPEDWHLVREMVIDEAKEEITQIIGREEAERQVKAIVKVSDQLTKVVSNQSNILDLLNEALSNDVDEEELIEMVLSLSKQTHQGTSTKHERKAWAKSLIKKLRKSFLNQKHGLMGED